MEHSTTINPSPVKSSQTVQPKPLEAHNGFRCRQEKSEPSTTSISESSENYFANKEKNVNLEMYSSNMTFGDREAAT